MVVAQNRHRADQVSAGYRVYRYELRHTLTMPCNEDALPGKRIDKSQALLAESAYRDLLHNSIVHRLYNSAGFGRFFALRVAAVSQHVYPGVMSTERLEDLKTGLVKDFEAHKKFISHEGLLHCTLCNAYEKELSRLERSEAKR